jgi:chromosome segregation ATPase
MGAEREAQYMDMETEFEKSTTLRDARINMQRANIETLEGCIRDSQRVHAIQLSELAAGKLKIGTLIDENAQLQAELHRVKIRTPISMPSSGEMEALLAQVTIIQGDLQLAYSKCAELESNVTTTTTAIHELTATVERLTFELDTSELRGSTLEIDLKEAQRTSVKTHKLLVPQISSQLMLPVLGRLPTATADLHYFEVSLLFDGDSDLILSDTGDQQKKSLSNYPTFPTIQLTTAKSASKEARLAEFAYSVDEFALQHSGSLSDVTFGRFASD